MLLYPSNIHPHLSKSPFNQKCTPLTFYTKQYYIHVCLMSTSCVYNIYTQYVHTHVHVATVPIFCVHTQLQYPSSAYTYMYAYTATVYDSSSQLQHYVQNSGSKFRLSVDSRRIIIPGEYTCTCTCTCTSISAGIQCISRKSTTTVSL